ncbi:hypothetical protein A2V49_00730 [candidate division WWE3 bacterium RBG_19FT_COMBO_34_6]|uniref:Phospholipid/glycerol acyltransferase domain-containing protein n=1 Tax=candidate division WWE3 bacterium RBG_19FT_COMBO_34_6 TaxID=1802612 RepID=A0A1F4UK61_UNCKA|nr:MAG: hypothetical protein A2V49_00730 [candidate division WWE3 bacterium RBG_19FT_COMBO_34_6]
MEGKENLPEKGPVIVCANHNDYLDSPIILFSLGKDIWGIAGSNYRYNPMVFLYRMLGRVIFIRRGESDRVAIKKALEVLKKGYYLGMAPEGTRSKTGKLARGKPGPAYLAGLTDAWIVPVGIIGSKGAFKNIFRKRTKIKVIIGKPFKLSKVDDPNPGKKWQYLTDTRIMPAIAELLPTDMRGVYE